jgi:hypothetical protein
MGKNNTLYFLSSNDGAYNLYQLKISNDGKAEGTPKKLTNFKMNLFVISISLQMAIPLFLNKI